MTDEKDQNGMSKGPKRVLLNADEINSISKEEMVIKWKCQEDYIEYLEDKLDSSSSLKNESTQIKLIEEKMRKQVTESSRKENMLLLRLTQKEAENHELGTQIQELKDNRTSANQQLRMMLLDPAVNVMFERMKKELQDCKKKLEQTQNDLSAWKFTPDSQTGKRLMARIRLLLQENEELGKMIHSGRTAKLESEIALEKKLVQEMKKSQAEFDEFLVEIDEETEGMQSTIYILQQQLKEAREVIQQLTQELEPVKPGAAHSILNRIRLEGSTSSVMKDVKTLSSNSISDNVVTPCPETHLDRGPPSDSNVVVKHEAMDVDDECNNRKIVSHSQLIDSTGLNGDGSDGGESPRTHTWGDVDSNLSAIDIRTTHRTSVSRTEFDSPSCLTLNMASDAVPTRTDSKNSSSSS